MRSGKWRFLAIAALTVLAFVAGPASAQQAGISLKGSDVALSHHNDTDWTLDKDVVLFGSPPVGVVDGVVTWNVTATRGATSDNFIEVNGFVSVQNTGLGDATIGNIVVNLQRSRPINKPNFPKNLGNKWVSASANVGNAFSGDAATEANIVAAASEENVSWNTFYNTPATYATSGSMGTFKENAASGPVEFTDADSNTVWAITPQQTIAAGDTVNLIFSAVFNNTILGIPVGESLRTEVIVSFGNAGARGASGAAGSNIDISGNGSIEADEAKVRSVPTRIGRTVPVLEECNDTVTLLDTGISETGTVTHTSEDLGGYGGAGVEIDVTTSFDVTASGVEGGTDGGDICNDATLVGVDHTVSVIIGYEPDDGDPTTPLVPIYHVFLSCAGEDESAGDCQEVDIDVARVSETFGQGAWGQVPNGSNVGQLLADWFSTVYPSGVEVGIPGAGGYSMIFSSALRVQNYLPAGGAGGPAALTADMTGAITSTSSRVFGGQVLALRLNVDFSAENITAGDYFGSFVLTSDADTLSGTDSLSLDGLTVAQILAVANIALGNGTAAQMDAAVPGIALGEGTGVASRLPLGYTYGTLNQLVDRLNNAFDDGTGWAGLYLD